MHAQMESLNLTSKKIKLGEAIQDFFNIKPN